MGNIIAGAVVLGLIALAVFTMVRNRKKGKCAGGCGSCTACPRHLGGSGCGTAPSSNCADKDE